MEQDLTLIWTHILSEMKKKVSIGNFSLFSNTALVNLEEDIATIASPSTMVIDLIHKRFYADIKSLLDLHTGKDNELFFVVKTISKAPPIDEKSSGPLFTTTELLKDQTTIGQGNESLLIQHQPSLIGHPPRVRQEYTFSTFAVSGTNQLAFVTSQTVAANIGKQYNPFFLYGPVGVGKTHLMNAIANDVYQRMPDKKIIYITSEEFTNEVVEAIRNNETPKMKRRFRTAYLLLIDDIQFIEGKDRVQEELFHTFNILIDQGSQIVLSSDRPPQEIKKLETRLSSRFSQGLNVDIEPPDFELKTAILLKKAEKYNKELPIDVAKLIANASHDTRALEGLLLKVFTTATINNSEITFDIARRALGAAAEEKRGSLHADDIIKEACNFYNIKPTQLKGPKRDASLVKARQITMYLLKNELGLTYVEIGNILGGRDHTTVMHGVDKMEKQLPVNVHISEDITGIKRLLSV